jgi:hypothetical protein
MSFRIRGLDPALFAPLFDLSDAALAARGARRTIADEAPGFPCRVSLTDAAVGDEVILTHFEHHAVASPFRQSHAIYVRRGETPYDAVDAIPVMLRARLLSVRAYDDDGMLVGADVVDGTALEAGIAVRFDDPRARYLHVHFARPGCYAARVDRFP